MRTYWEECFDKRWTLKNPFGEDAVVRLRGCARILEKDEEIFFEIEVPQGSKQWKISDSCYELKYEVISVRACIKDIEFQDGWPRRLKIKVEGCVHLPVWQDCETLYEDEIGLAKVNVSAMTPLTDSPTLTVPANLNSMSKDDFFVGVSRRPLLESDVRTMSAQLANEV